MKIFILFLTLWTSLLAIDTGEFSLYVMKEGKPLSNQQIVIFKKDTAVRIDNPGAYNKHAEFETDGDGSLYTVLPVGAYQMQIVAKDNGVVQAFVRKNFIIKMHKESQLIIMLKNDNSVAFADEEAPKIAVEENNSTKTELVEGFFQLTLSSSEDKSSIEGARVFVKGLSIDVKTDKQGNVVIKAPVGLQTISIIHSSFSSQTLNVEVIKNETVMKLVELTPAAMELEEFVVLAPQVEGSVASVMAEERNSDSIASIIGAEQMSKQGDSNAASALKRVAGVTIMGGKYIYVRGLGDRYSSTELNGMSLPSPNPTKRTVPLDMFPSGVIGSLQVQKTFTPDVTGAFGGGYVNIRTKKSSDEDYVKLKLGLNAHDSVGTEVYSYDGAPSDWTGFDHSYRPFNDAFIQSQDVVLGERRPSLTDTPQEMKSMLQERNVNNYAEKVPMGGEGQIEVSKSWTIADEHEVSVLGSYNYKKEAKLVTFTSHDYITSRDGVQESTPDNTAVTDQYKTNFQHGGLLNLNYEFRNFDMGYTMLYVVNTIDQTRSVAGTFGENNSDELQSYFEWQERELFVNQVYAGLDYKLLVDNRLDVGFEYATASEYVPNDVFYDYRRTDSTQPYAFQARQSRLTYNSRTTDDELFNFTLKNRSMIPLLSEEDYVELGFVTESKIREGRRLELTVQSKITDPAVNTGSMNDILNYGDGTDLTYDVTSKPKDQFDATLDRNALYLKGLLKPLENVSVTYGGRYVDLRQSVDQYAVERNVVTTETNTLAFQKMLPSLGVKYEVNQENQLKFAYSETFVYPDFREFVDAEFIHPVFLAKISGNPDLIETDIQSLDARYDFFFSPTDSVNVSLFYKHMDNPIEDTQEFTTGTLPRYSFENSLAADLAGFELGWYKNLGFMHSLLDNMTFYGNYTYIASQVELSEEQKQKYVTQDRGLQGLSPQVLNLSISYEESEDRTLNLSYNKMAERLMRVALKNGTVVYALDDYEVPPDLLDFTWIEQFRVESLDTTMAFTFKVKNLLDDETIWKQGDNTTLKYKTGRSYSASISAKF